APDCSLAPLRAGRGPYGPGPALCFAARVAGRPPLRGARLLTRTASRWTRPCGPGPALCFAAREPGRPVVVLPRPNESGAAASKGCASCVTNASGAVHRLGLNGEAGGSVRVHG